MEPGADCAGDNYRGASLRFGPFEFDVCAGELCKGGRRIRLQEQPFQILRMLLESPGEVVWREDIRKRLWPGNTVVGFDHSISVAVRRLRDALCDSADEPRYIETVARRGYRFIATIERISSAPVPVPSAVLLTESAVASRPEDARRARFRFVQRWVPIAAILAAIVLVWGGVNYELRRQPPGAADQPLTRLYLELGTELPPSSESLVSTAISPDGRRVVYMSGSKLFSRSLDQPTGRELAGTEAGRSPFFSPDGRWVGFFAKDDLKKVSIAGGQAAVLAKCPLGHGGSWSDDGSIIAGCNFTLSKVPASGGPLIPLTELPPGEIVHRWPQVLPGGKAVLFTAYPAVTGVDGAAIRVISTKDRRVKTLVPSGTWGRYLMSGHLVYVNNGALFAVPFDPNALELRGTPVRVLDEIAYSAAFGCAQIDFTRTGTLVYRSSRAGRGLVTIQWFDNSGGTKPLLPVPGNYLSPTLSPDGSRLALTSAGDIWVYALGHGRMTRLTVGGGYTTPVWSVDGQYLVFRAARDMLWIRADGTGQPSVLSQSSNQQTPWSFSPDGKQLAFVEIDPKTGADIWTVPVETGPSGLRAGRPEVFLRTSFHERGPAFSPDGRWIAYMSDESGDYRVYVKEFPHGAAKRQVSTDPGGYPAWSRNGRQLFFLYLGPDRQIKTVSYSASRDTFVAETPRIFPTKIAHFGTTRSYDPAPDGKRVVALTAAEDAPEGDSRLEFLLNFFDELRRRVPGTYN